jgi:hypothetical protein
MVSTTEVLQISLDTTGTTPYETGLAIVILLVVGVVLAIGTYRMRFGGLSDEQERHKRALSADLDQQSPQTLRVSAEEGLAARKEGLQALFDPSNRGGKPPTVRSAAGDVRQALELAWGDRTAGIPRLTIRLLEEALLVLVLGGLAIVPSSTINYWLRSGDEFDPSEAIGAATQSAESMADLFYSGLAAFPVSDTLFGLGLAAVIEAGTVLYNNWLAVGITLVACALGLAWLHRKSPDDLEHDLYSSRLRAGVSGVARLTVVWAAGVVPASIGRLVGFETVGDAVGLAAAGIVVLLFARGAVRGARARLRRAARTNVGEWSRAGMTYLVLRRVAAGFGAAAVPIILAWGSLLVSTGKLGEIVSMISGGTLEAKATIGAGIVIAMALLALQVRDAWPDIRTALGEAFGLKAVRVAIYRRAAPTGVIVFGYFLAIGFGLTVPLAILAGLAGGLLARGLYVLARRAKYRAEMIGGEEITASRFVVEAFVLEDDDGEMHPYARLNGTPMAHNDVDTLVDELVAASQAAKADGEIPPSVERKHAEDLLDYGLTSVEETETKLQQWVHDEIVGNLRNNEGALPVEDLEQRLDDYPDDLWQQQLRALRLKRGLIQQRGDYYVLQ